MCLCSLPQGLSTGKFTEDGESYFFSSSQMEQETRLQVWSKNHRNGANLHLPAHTRGLSEPSCCTLPHPSALCHRRSRFITSGV